jgi:histone H3/H4
MDLPAEAIREIMENTGAERIGDDAVEAVRNLLKDYAEEITEDAIAIAKHAGRKTVTAKDIQLAKKA